MRTSQGFTGAKRHLAATISILLCLLMLALLSSCISVNEGLISAAQRGDANKIKRLVEKGADVHAKDKDGEGETALMKAARYGHTEAIYLLIEKGADINARAKDG